MDGLRRFIEADNHSAVDVGDMRRGTITLEVQKPNFSEAVQDATIREGAGELTLQTDEVGTLRAFMNTQTTLSVRGGDRRMLVRTGKTSAKQSTKDFF